MSAAEQVASEIEGAVWVQRVADDRLYSRISMAANRVWEAGGGRPTVESVSEFMAQVKHATESRRQNAGLKLPPVPGDDVIAIALDEYFARK